MSDQYKIGVDIAFTGDEKSVITILKNGRIVDAVTLSGETIESLVMRAAHERASLIEQKTLERDVPFLVRRQGTGAAVIDRLKDMGSLVVEVDPRNGSVSDPILNIESILEVLKSMNLPGTATLEAAMRKYMARIDQSSKET